MSTQPADLAAQMAATVRRLLHTEQVMTLATVGPDGPWAADVFFAADGLRLYFWSSPDSRHGHDIDTSGRAAATIHPPPTSWQAIVGLQLQGTAERVQGAVDNATAMAAYLGRFPFARDLLTHPGTAMARAARTRPYVLIPEQVRLVDNSFGFGARAQAVVRGDTLLVGGTADTA